MVISNLILKLALVRFFRLGFYLEFVNFLELVNFFTGHSENCLGIATAV
jgi:hypothetical protein